MKQLGSIPQQMFTLRQHIMVVLSRAVDGLQQTT